LTVAEQSLLLRPGLFPPRPTGLGLRPAEDARWQPFVAQLGQRSHATIVPVWFSGQNSQFFQIASHLSETLRLSLIFHEVKARIGTKVRVMIGVPIAFAEVAKIKDRQALADQLRAHTYGLARFESGSVVHCAMAGITCHQA
jgi:putative hemolysin